MKSLQIPVYRTLPSVPSWLLLLLLLISLAGRAQTLQNAAPASGENVADQPGFDVLEYRVLGNTVLDVMEIQRVLYPLLGEKKTIDDVESARKTLETVYHNAGWGTVFVDIPEQSTADGIIRLSVTEGRLDRVNITGARYFSHGQIRAGLSESASGKVPNLPRMQAELTTINGVSADRSVVPLLKAGRVPGSVDLELRVDDQLPLHGSLEVNDRYTADTTRLRVNGSLSYNNLFQRQHSLSLQYQTAPEEPDEVQVVVGSYMFRVPSWRNTTLAAYAVDSKTDVSTVGALSVIGNGKIYGGRVIQLLMQAENYHHSVTFGVDYKDFLEKIPLDTTEELTTPISYFNWSIAYAGTLRGETSTLIPDVSVNFGLRGLGNDQDEFAEKRFHGAANYFYLRGGLQYLRKMPLGFELSGRVSGQATVDPLVSNEQFSIGGVYTVRGYLESSHLGDYGMNGSFELRNSWLFKPLKLSPDTAYLLAFYDAATTAIIDPLPAQTARFTLSSWGVGLRLGSWHGFNIATDWARVLKDAGDIRGGDDRVHFSANYAF